MIQLTDDEYDDIYEEMTEIVYETIEEKMLYYFKYNFKDEIVQECTDYFVKQGIEQEWCDEDDTVYIETIIHKILDNFLYYVMEIPHRELKYPLETPLSIHKELIQTQLSKINAYPIQKQRSVEWYEIRSKLFSASNIWKLLNTESQYNSLLYEKCKSFDTQKYESYSNISNYNTSLNWGVKYEPVTMMVYEHMFQTFVSTNYGCIPHERYPIGASPDGIVNDIQSEKYGRMVEVKNIFNRDITGIPSNEYWIQVQIQLETTGLQYCDFVETRFKEFPDYDAFQASDVSYKGVILYFIPVISSFDAPVIDNKFIYMPLNIVKTEEIETWKQTQISLHNTYALSETIYWYLDEISCVLIERNPVWFKQFIPIITTAWQTVEKEKVDGFEHRCPQKRKPKQDDNPDNKDIKLVGNSICLIKLDEFGNVMS
jgi:hypothetical protein